MLEVEIESKTKEEAIRKAQEALNANVNEFIYHITEIKGKLFKGTTYKIKAVTLTKISDIVKEYLEKIIQTLGVHSTIDIQIMDRKLNVNINSDNNPILIGKNGQTIKALEILAKQYIENLYQYYININIDIENYKEKKVKRLENMAKKIAKEVVTTQIEVKLENMNSYERMIVHNALTTFKGVTTISEGEEPNRHVIIKPVVK